MDPLRVYIEEIVRQVLATEREREARQLVAEYLTVREAARTAAVATGTVRRWIREGKLTAYGAGRGLRVKRCEIDALMQSGPSVSASRTPAGLARDTSPEALAVKDDARLNARAMSRSVPGKVTGAGKDQAGQGQARALVSNQ